MNVVEFPGLWGLKLNIDRVAFEVFGLPIYWYGVIIALAFLAAVLLALRDCKKFGIEPDNILDAVLFAAPAAIICARLYYVAFSWDQFSENPIDIINTRKGGLAIYGGVIGALVTAYIYAKVKKIGFLKLFDFSVPFIVLGQGIGRWGNFVNQEAFGSATTLPWRMTSETIREYLSTVDVSATDMVSNVGVHPTFLYESLVDFAIFFFLIWYRHRKKADGEVFFLYMILYGIGRACIEGLRTDSLMLGIGEIRVSQLLAALFALAFIPLFVLVRRKQSAAIEEEEVEIGSSSYGSVLTKLKEDAEKEAVEKEALAAEEANRHSQVSEDGNTDGSEEAGETEDAAEAAGEEERSGSEENSDEMGASKDS
jgi:phosphatidylglycerol:prolipoprotein diacylglycerol transferase